MANQQISVTVNGTTYQNEVEPRLLLVHYLRDVLELTGTHIGCDTTQCGACTVIIDGAAVKSCTIFAVQAAGTAIQTVEGLAKGEHLDAVQEGFWEEHGLQCGFCTPGMLMLSKAFLSENPDPSEAEIRHALHGNLCRCTGYEHIVNAIQYAARTGGGAELQHTVGVSLEADEALRGEPETVAPVPYQAEKPLVERENKTEGSST